MKAYLKKEAKIIKDYLNYNGPFYCANCKVIMKVDKEFEDISCNCNNIEHQNLILICKNCCQY